MAYSPQDANSIVEGFYRQHMGRAPDQSGAAYWSQQLQAGKPPEDVASYMRNVGMLGELPRDPAQPDAGGGGLYRDQARSFTAGLNRMPGVMSDLANLSAAPGAAQETMYPAAMNTWQATMQNPILASDPSSTIAGLYREILGRDGSPEHIAAYANWARNTNATPEAIRAQFMRDAQAEMQATGNPLFAGDPAQPPAGNPLLM